MLHTLLAQYWNWDETRTSNTDPLSKHISFIRLCTDIKMIIDGERQIITLHYFPKVVNSSNRENTCNLTLERSILFCMFLKL